MDALAALAPGGGMIAASCAALGIRAPVCIGASNRRGRCGHAQNHGAHWTAMSARPFWICCANRASLILRPPKSTPDLLDA